MDLNKLFNKEWIDTNGLGGYASSSISGANTRKYHGLLVAAQNPPTERKVLIAKIEERVFMDGQPQDISVNQYPGTIHPQGHQFLKSFERKPLAQWHYEGENWSLSKKVFMVPNSNSTVVIYENTGNKAMDFEAHPLLEYKDYHWTMRQNDFDFYYEKSKSKIKVHPYPDCPATYISWSKGEFQEDRAWYHNIELPKEHYRGQDFIEDYYRIGFIRAQLGKGQKLGLILSTDEKIANSGYSSLEKKTLAYHNAQKDKTIGHSFYNDLLASGNQFIVNRDSTNSKSIIAGYHWFTDWGRDTMIAMRGLTISVGDQETSKSILKTFLKYVNLGMLPNRFPDYEEQDLEYNTIDATLWLFIALYEYEKKFKDRAFIDENIKILEDVLLYHIGGTRFNIHLTEEGFISGGQSDLQLTWMDAKVGDYVVTPRIGCPVEINALWYNALCIYEHYCYNCNHELHGRISEVIEKFKKNFPKRFLNKDGYLNDVVTSEMEDESFRPNQIYAISLPFSILTKDEEKKIVKLVGERLLTDYGLRTLENCSPQFRPHYGGDQWQRDTAYHQGTVWPFLLMEYWQAYLKVNNFTIKAKKEVIKKLGSLKNHFYNEDCIHGISEIFDGENPNDGRGCANQAWSVAALLKLYSDHRLYELDV